jgi:hypothetical protein
LAAHWLDGIPIDDGVAYMGKIEDRIRDYAPAGRPVATGVTAVADSWSCTNPSLGRGASVGLAHAVGLRDTLRRASDDPWQLCVDWAETTRTDMEPWYRTTVAYDRNRLAQIQADIDGAAFAGGDAEWSFFEALAKGGMADPVLLRAFLSIGMVLRRPDELLAEGSLMDRISGATNAVGEPPPLGPARDQVLAALAG